MSIAHTPHVAAGLADAEEEVDSWGPDTRVCLTPRAYRPTPTDLDAQAAADRDQEQADRDYRELGRLALTDGAGACRWSIAGKAPCLGCRVARWLALGL
jgi:hypothetical protein